MRTRGLLLFAAVLAMGCTNEGPTAGDEQFTPTFGLQANGSLVALHGVILTNAAEVPACPSLSGGSAQIKIFSSGQIGSAVILYNRKGKESIRFGHIHHLNPGAATGPIIWWLSSPVGVDLNITADETRITQFGTFVTNGHFSSNDAGIAEILARPQDFYVNFHSDNCPGGFARGFLSANPG